jgi:hypothetical protein
LHGVGDGTVNCKKYKPRLTRQQRHDAGLKGQLKAEKAAHEDATAARIAAYKDLYGRYVALEQKGLDAVAKTVEKDNAILANNDTRWSNLVKRLEEKVAASVPLANAIKTFRPSYLYDEFHAVMYVENTPIKHLGKPVMKAHVVADFEADHEVKGDELTLLYKRVKEEKQNEI